MQFRMNTASAEQIFELFSGIRFPEVRGQTPMDMAYAEKLHRLATRIEAWDGDLLAGIVCVYTNDPHRETAYAPLLCARPGYAAQGAALARRTIAYCRDAGFRSLRSGDIDEENHRVVALYRRLGLQVIAREGRRLTLEIVFRR
jgi:GNAT superfamily N-acetyltransferase